MSTQIQHRIPSQDLSSQADTFITEYAVYYNLPVNLGRNEIIERICHARSTIPILPNLAYIQSENGRIHFTGRVTSLNNSEPNEAPLVTSFDVPDTRSGPVNSMGAEQPLTNGETNDSAETTSPTRVRPVVPPHRALTRGAHVFLAMREAAERYAEWAAQNGQPDDPNTNIAQSQPPSRRPMLKLDAFSPEAIEALEDEPSPSLRPGPSRARTRLPAGSTPRGTAFEVPELPALKSVQMLPRMEDGHAAELSRSQRPTAPLPRRAVPRAPTSNPSVEAESDLHEDPTPPPVRRYNAPSPTSTRPTPLVPRAMSSPENSPSPKTPSDDGDLFPIPFPTIEESPAVESQPLPDEPQSPVGPRYVYPPTIKGDWLDIMLDDLVSGRVSIKNTLEKVKQEVRLALESVTKAQVAVRAEAEEWDGFYQYLREIVGDEMLEMLEQDAKILEEHGSDYDPEEDEERNSAIHGESEGNSNDRSDEDGDEGPGHPGMSGFGAGSENGNQGEQWPSDVESPEYETPSRPPRGVPARGKRVRDSEDPPTRQNQHKRSKSSHSPDSSDSEGGSDFLPCSMHPPTPRLKRPRSDSDSEDEVEQSVRKPSKEASAGNIDDSEQPSPPKRFRPYDESIDLYPAPPDNEDEDDYSYPQFVYPHPDEETVDAGGQHEEVGDDNEEEEEYEEEEEEEEEHEEEEEEEHEPADIQESPSLLGYLGRLFNLQPSTPSTPASQQAGPSTQSLPQSSNISGPTPANPQPASQPNVQPSHPIPPTPPPQAGPSTGPSYNRARYCPSPPRGALMPTRQARPLTRTRERVYLNHSDPAQRFRVFNYDETEDWHFRQLLHAQKMYDYGVADWKAPPKYFEEYAEIRAIPPVALYGFLDEE